MAPIRVLLTNDDGPPSRDSPFILGLYLELQKRGFEVKVVIPSSQKSWIGKAYQIHDTITGRYYYPRDRKDGPAEISDVSRPLQEGELGEWVLLDGTPATCTNIGLYNLYPGQIDLVISGPNFGRNTSSSFMLSSGTIGAALSGTLSLVRSISISYGLFAHPSPKEYVQPAQNKAADIVEKLWRDWGHDPVGPRGGEVDLYNVNIPLVKEILDQNMEVVWTRIWRNSYESLFQPKAPQTEPQPAGPDVPPSPASKYSSVIPPPQSPYAPQKQVPILPLTSAALTFRFAPQMSGLVNPPIESLPYGTDAWAVHHGKISVTPLRASFAEPEKESMSFKGEEGKDAGKPWKWKL